VATRWWKNFEDIFIRIGATHERDRRTDRQTDRQTPHADIYRAYAYASSGKNGLTYRHSFFSPYGSPIILVLLASNTSSRNSDGVTPCGGAKYRWGIKNSRFSTNKSLYLPNDARYRHSYYGRRIGTHMRSIKMVPFPITLNEP